MKPKIIQITGVKNDSETQSNLMGLDERGNLYVLQNGNSNNPKPHWGLLVYHGEERVGIRFDD